jgi:hypothetical protein
MYVDSSVGVLFGVEGYLLADFHCMYDIYVGYLVYTMFGHTSSLAQVHTVFSIGTYGYNTDNQ